MKCDAIELIQSCKTIDELKAVWNRENVDTWKRRKDFNQIFEAKESQKETLTWPVSLQNAMRRYDEAVDAFETAETPEQAITADDDGVTLEQQIAELYFRVINNPAQYRPGADGLAILRVYHDWYGNKEQIKFGV